MTVKNYFPAAENKLFDAGGGLTRKVAAYNDNAMCVEAPPPSSGDDFDDDIPF